MQKIIDGSHDWFLNHWAAVVNIMANPFW